ncbi:zinc-ribbon domain-containing protein [Romeria aff. gracilis LEGE 07310]|uniref:Zinc-ribbon domain-containing protein n=1 Tax=Vasconcelosia minhoensis LEGE 07310 TaxID=915328 RepID=A0A8J7A8G1_9CYAN|nr:zinc-ribbon domain-containing protein [Romeria gracilis]MBE9075881.1 zinc-ribbon domain-containing protein [Romeria aff. gracilis LEGE 07310]
MSETKKYQASNLNLDSLVQAVKDWLQSQNFTVQSQNVHGGGKLIQARQEQLWRNATGMASALNIVLRQENSDLFVEIGTGKWSENIDKAIATTVGIFFLWPFMATAAVGFWKQNQVPKRTFEFIEQFIDTDGENSAELIQTEISNFESLQSQSDKVSAEPVSAGTISNRSYQFCASCGETLPEGARFCSNCGAKIE